MQILLFYIEKLKTSNIHRCSCNPGYTGNGTNCQNIDECVDKNICGPHAYCADVNGGYTCTCSIGFSGSFVNGYNGSCEDIDECQSDQNVCGPEAECMNTVGSFDCLCRHGFKKYERSCQRKCFITNQFRKPFM